MQPNFKGTGNAEDGGRFTNNGEKGWISWINY